VGSPFGTLVAHVAPGSPAAKAGLEPGDLITAIDNEPIGAVDDVNAALDRLHSGQTIELSFTRGPASFTVPVKLAARPSGHP
jgi:S1-C subfamily serine protease